MRMPSQTACKRCFAEGFAMRCGIGDERHEGVPQACYAVARRGACDVCISIPVRIWQVPANVPFSLRNNRRLEGWIRLEADET